MCGRYFVDEDTAKELEKIVEELDLKHNVGKMSTGDVVPSGRAKILIQREKHIEVSNSTWGFPKYTGKGLIINARAETAMEKRTFRENVWNRRCVIPAKGFYEWDASKNKFRFTYGNESILFMAGMFQFYENMSRFVILTTNANPSMERVHDRMPLVLNREQLEPWIFDNQKISDILKSTPPLLKCVAEVEQLRLW